MSTQNVTPSPSNHSSSLPPPQFSSSCHVIKLTTGGHECDFHRCCRKKSDIFKMKIVSPESCVSSTPNSTAHLQSNLHQLGSHSIENKQIENFMYKSFLSFSFFFSSTPGSQATRQTDNWSEFKFSRYCEKIQKNKK